MKVYDTACSKVLEQFMGTRFSLVRLNFKTVSINSNLGLARTYNFFLVLFATWFHYRSLEAGNKAEPSHESHWLRQKGLAHYFPFIVCGSTSCYCVPGKLRPSWLLSNVLPLLSSLKKPLVGTRLTKWLLESIKTDVEVLKNQTSGQRSSTRKGSGSPGVT